MLTKFTQIKPLELITTINSVSAKDLTYVNNIIEEDKDCEPSISIPVEITNI